MVLEGNSQETPGKKKGPGIRARIMASSTDAPGSPTKGARRDKAASSPAAKRQNVDAPLSPPGTVNAKK
jgi:hypothetical protein